MAEYGEWGAYCSVADAIVPIYGTEPCDWCGHDHIVRYRWNQTTHEWEDTRG